MVLCVVSVIELPPTYTALELCQRQSCMPSCLSQYLILFNMTGRRPISMGNVGNACSPCGVQQQLKFALCTKILATVKA